MPADEPRSSGPGGRRDVFALAGIGMMNATSLLAGGALGWWLDSRFGTTPAFLFLGMLSGIVLGITSTYREIRKYLND